MSRARRNSWASPSRRREPRAVREDEGSDGKSHDDPEHNLDDAIQGEAPSASRFFCTSMTMVMVTPAMKVPAEAIGGKPHEKIEYRSIGLSEGFGSFHISQETLGLMGTLIGRSKEARKVNSIFGEGVNPLMRKIREGMELLGLPSDVLMNHGNKRVVYGVALARNFRDVLLGFTDSAQYNVPRTRDRLRTEKIADFWRHRWLLNRLEKPGILEEVTKHTTVYPIKHGAQVTLPEEQQPEMPRNR